MTELAEKQCGRCGEVKPVEEFYLKGYIRKDGSQPRHANCRPCVVSYMQGHYASNHANYLYRGAKTRAKRRGLAFDIELSDIEIPEFCPVFPHIALKPYTGKRVHWQDHPDSPTIDRIDSSKGYVKGNVRVISWRANTLKGDATIEESILLGQDAERIRST